MITSSTCTNQTYYKSDVKVVGKNTPLLHMSLGKAGEKYSSAPQRVSPMMRSTRVLRV